MKRLLCWLCLLVMLFSCAYAESDLSDDFDGEELPLPPMMEEAPAATPKPAATPQPTEDPWPFAIRSGPTDQKRIAITMDDCFDRTWVRETFALCKQYNVPVTFFPLGDQLKENEADLWREIAASDCEIGSHTQHHNYTGHLPNDTIITHIRRFQEVLDNILGYHYEVQCLRPPYGNYSDKNGNKTGVIRLIRRCGYNHIILWNVSETDANRAIKQAKNGAIMLFHARKKDYNCLVKLIPALIDKGYELVTVSELLGIGEIQTSDELYVYNKNDYR